MLLRRLRSPPLLLRALCTAAKPAVRPLPTRGGYTSLTELCSELRDYGVGSRVYRESWAEKDYDPEKFHWTLVKTYIVSSRPHTSPRSHA